MEPTNRSVQDRLTRKRFAYVRSSRVRAKASINNVLHETAVIKLSALIRHVMMPVTRADVVCGKRITTWKLQFITSMSSVIVEELNEVILRLPGYHTLTNQPINEVAFPSNAVDICIPPFRSHRQYWTSTINRISNVKTPEGTKSALK